MKFKCPVEKTGRDIMHHFFKTFINGKIIQEMYADLGKLRKAG